MKKNWLKESNKGFSLVELIVVIAVMAILVGVAVPVYSSYIEKSQKAADQQLVDEIEHALALYYASNASDIAKGSFVVLHVDAATDNVTTGWGEDVMKQTFGDNWKKDIKLKYDGWNSAGMLSVLSGYTLDDLKLIDNSTYLTQSTTEGLMSAVDVMTDLASAVIADSNIENAKTNLKLVLGTDNAAPVIAKLEELALLDDPVAISNMLVSAMADSLDDRPALQTIVTEYAAAYVYSLTPEGDDEALKQMQHNLENATILSLTDEDEALDMLYAGFEDPKFAGFDDYLGDYIADPSYENDKDALSAMLSAVKEISGGFQDKASLQNGDLYTTEGVLDQVDDYVNAVETLAGLSQAELSMLQGLPANSVAIFISGEGVTAVYPGTASAK